MPSSQPPDLVLLKQCVRCLGEGEIVVDRWEDAKGYPREKCVTCPTCEGRTYELPDAGFYYVKLLSFGRAEELTVARVADDKAEFVGLNWDASYDSKISWLRKFAELDGSAPT